MDWEFFKNSVAVLFEYECEYRQAVTPEPLECKF